MIPILLAGVLVGCGHSSSDSQKDSASDQTSESVVSSSDSSSSESSSSVDTSAASVKPSQKAKKTTRTKKAATTANQGQVTQTSVLNAVANQMSSQYSRQDILMSASNVNGIYTVQVQENHQSPAMQQRGVDPSVNPTVAWFQTNTKGQLLRSDNGGASYYVVGNAY